MPPQTDGSWGPSNSAKGRSQKLAEHRGYFGQGSSHLPGQEAEELAHEQSSQKQPPALLRSPLQRIWELTCPPASIWTPCLRAHLLPGRGQRFPPCRRSTKDSVSFSPTTGSSWRAAQHPQPGKHPCHPGQEGSALPASHPGLAAAPSICSPKVSLALPPALQLQGSVSVTLPSLLSSYLRGVPRHADQPDVIFDTGVHARPVSAGDTAK